MQDDPARLLAALLSGRLHVVLLSDVPTAPQPR
jgi:hypothetical protein